MPFHANFCPLPAYTVVSTHSALVELLARAQQNATILEQFLVYPVLCSCQSMGTEKAQGFTQPSEKAVRSEKNKSVWALSSFFLPFNSVKGAVPPNGPVPAALTCPCCEGQCTSGSTKQNQQMYPWYRFPAVLLPCT